MTSRAAEVIAALEGQLSIDAQQWPAVRDTVTADLEIASERYPLVRVEPARFAAFLAERARVANDAATYLQTACVRDLVLACACLDGDPAALVAFDAAILRQLEPSLRRLLPSPSDRDEVLQLARHKLLVSGDDRRPHLTSYAGTGNLRAFCTVVATRLALTLVRAHDREVLIDDDDGLAGPALDADPELRSIKNNHRVDFAQALLLAIKLLSTRERTLLRQTFLDGLTVDELGALYQVHRATAARWVAAARSAVKAHTRRLLIERYGVREDEVDSLIRVLHRSLDVTLSGVLAADADPS